MFGMIDKLRKTTKLETIQKLKEIFVNAVTADTLAIADVSMNLQFIIISNIEEVLDSKHDVRIAQKIISCLNENNIIKIPRLLLGQLIRDNPLSATTIAKIITPKNITHFVRALQADLQFLPTKYRYNAIFLLICADYACASIIAQNAITEDNFDENIGLVDFFLQLETPRFERIFSKLKAFGPYVQRKNKEYEEREKQRKIFEEFMQNKFFSSGPYSNYAPAMNTTTMSQADAYKTLGLPTTALPEEITKQYRKLAREYHPDVNSHKPELEKKEAEKKMVILNEAYEVLTRRSRL
jgi:hypothetical protein